MRWVDPVGEYPALRVTPMLILRAVLRGIPLFLLIFGSLIALLVLRLIERPIFGQHRPWTPYIVQFVCRNGLRLLGMNVATHGEIMKSHGAIVANHCGWLDIFILNANKRFYFVSKAEVAKWPGIGALARATGTVFIERRPKFARAQRDLLAERLGFGHKLLFFPEGTSTNGHVVAPFKSTLFEALVANRDEELSVQPVTICYRAPNGGDSRFYGWWGEELFSAHLLRIMGARRQGRADVFYHQPLRVEDFEDRKSLAKACEKEVSAKLTAVLEADQAT